MQHYFSDYHMSHTASVNAWWQVTLAQEYYISHIDIYNRLDCCQGRLDGALVLLDGVQIATVNQVYNVQKYTFPVEERGNFFNV